MEKMKKKSTLRIKFLIDINWIYLQREKPPGFSEFDVLPDDLKIK